MDLDSREHQYDAHVRLEGTVNERVIAVDVFRSEFKDANKAHVDSDAFPVTLPGARGATLFLSNYGFEVRVGTPKAVKQMARA
jgi:hypothetical protein